MKQTADALRDIVNNISPRLAKLEDNIASRKPSKDKWSPKEIIGHLIDSASNNQMKFVKLIETNLVDLSGYHQDEWVAIQQYQKYDWNDLLDLWKAVNLHIAHIIKYAPESALENKLKIEGQGLYTLKFIMNDYPEHLKHHLNQIFPDLNLETKFEMVY